MNAEMLKGHLEAILLAVVEAGPAHGYAITEAVRRLTDGAFELPDGTIYPALHRLEQAGLLKSDWNTTDGRRRRVYSLTKEGGVSLGARRRDWLRFSGAVESILKGPVPWPTT